MADILGFIGGSGNAQNVTGAITDLIGGSSSQSTSGTSTSTATGTADLTSAAKTVGKKEAIESERLVLDDAAIQGIIQDVLGGAEGLASIFAGEQASGLFGGSATAQAAGDLSAKLVAEIAKITGEKRKKITGTEKEDVSQETTQTQTQDTAATTRATTETDDPGIFGEIGGSIERVGSEIADFFGF